MNSQPDITTDLVAQIMAKRKFVSCIKTDNRRSTKAERKSRDYVPPNEIVVLWVLRYAESREKDIPLLFHARQETALTGSVKPRPGVSLKWKGVRVRGVNWNIRHDNKLNGFSVEPVRGWHEKVWNEIDQDKHIVGIQDELKNHDLGSIIKFCCERWNIDEPYDRQHQLGGGL